MKRKSHFHFKQFALRDDQCAMKVGTDSVLLGAWAEIGRGFKILDIGTGSGLIALMMAQRSAHDAFIDGVEIEDSDAQQAMQNVLNSPWPTKVRIHHAAIREFKSATKYDLIITNPPFFINSLASPDSRRQQTRHTGLLDYETIIELTTSLLTPDGRLNIILPYTEGIRFMALAKNKLHCSRQYIFKTRSEKPPERLLLEFRFSNSVPDEGEILLYSHGLEWSEDYRILTQDFYL